MADKWRDYKNSNRWRGLFAPYWRDKNKLKKRLSNGLTKGSKRTNTPFRKHKNACLSAPYYFIKGLNEGITEGVTEGMTIKP